MSSHRLGGREAGKDMRGGAGKATLWARAAAEVQGRQGDLAVADRRWMYFANCVHTTPCSSNAARRLTDRKFAIRERLNERAEGQAPVILVLALEGVGDDIHAPHLGPSLDGNAVDVLPAGSPSRPLVLHEDV